jgi:hypothetical protein
MWVKRTDEEILAAKIQSKRLRRYGAIVIGVIVCALITFFRGRGWSAHYASNRVPLDEIPTRLPLAFVFGFLFGWFFYRRPSRRRTVVCPKCEKTKFEDSQWDCPCGGHFEDVETMKWV